MQAIFLNGVEIDRCTACAGLWFDWSELGRVSRRPMVSKRVAEATGRPCPRCKVDLVGAVLPPGITVERCGSCVGYFLEAGELEAFTGRSLPTAQPASSQGGKNRFQPATPASLEFACTGCGKRLTRSTGFPSRGALTCMRCAPQVHPVIESGSRSLEVLEIPLELLGGLLEVFDW